MNGILILIKFSKLQNNKLIINFNPLTPSNSSLQIKNQSIKCKPTKIKATMLKKIKSKRRLTEPHISPAVMGAGSSHGGPENGDRDKEPIGT